MPTQSADVSGGQFGIRYASAGLTWTVLGGVDVSGTAAGVYSEFGNSTLLNSGAISSPQYARSVCSIPAAPTAAI